MSDNQLQLVETVSPMDIVRMALTDPAITPEKARDAFALFKDMQAYDAKRQFIAAVNRAKRHMPAVHKNGTVTLGGKGSFPFSKYEDVQLVIEPILAAEGLSQSFIGEKTENDKVAIRMVVSHDAGWEDRSSCMELPPDNGPGRNALQAIGSSRSYCKRYLTVDYWDIRQMGMDDDANARSALTEEQLETIQNNLRRLNDRSGKDRLPDLLSGLRIKALTDLTQGRYQECIAIERVMWKDLTGKQL